MMTFSFNGFSRDVDKGVKSTLSILFVLLILASCSHFSTRHYYILAAVDTPRAPAKPSMQGVGIGVGPVQLAPYLTERRNVMFQSSPYRVEFSDDHFWASDLEGQLSQVLTSQLGRQFGTNRVKTYPWLREGDLDYQIAIDIIRFHGTPEGDAILEAHWRVYRLRDGRIMQNRKAILRDDLNDDGFEKLVAAQSRLVSRLSAEIVKKWP